MTDHELFNILKSIDSRVVRLPSGWRDFARAAIAAATVDLQNERDFAMRVQAAARDEAHEQYERALKAENRIAIEQDRDKAILAVGHPLTAYQDVMREREAMRAERDELRTQLAAAQALLPGVYDMDPPDGGSVEMIVQLRRMADDAARYRWLRSIDSYSEWNRCGHYAEHALDAIIDAALSKDAK